MPGHPVREAKDCGHRDQRAACASPATPTSDSATPGSSGRYVLTKPWGKGRQLSPDGGHPVCLGVPEGSALPCATFSSLLRGPRLCHRTPSVPEPLPKPIAYLSGPLELIGAPLRLPLHSPRPVAARMLA